MRTTASLCILLWLAALRAGPSPGEVPAERPAEARKGASAADLLAEAERLDFEGKWHEAGKVYERAIETAEETLGPDDPLTARALIGAADLQARVNPINASRYALLEKAKEILGGSLAPCGNALRRMPIGEREARARECLAEAERTTGPQSAETARALNLVGFVEYIKRDLGASDVAPEDLRRLAERAVEANTLLFGAGHPAAAWSELFLGSVLGTSGLCGESRAHLERALGIFERSLGPDRPPASLPLFAMLDSCSPPPEETARLAARFLLAGRDRCEQDDSLIDAPLWNSSHSVAQALIGRLNAGDADGAEEVVRLYPERVEREADRLGADDGCRAQTRSLEVWWASVAGDFAAGVRALRDIDRRMVAAYGPENPLLGYPLNKLAGMQHELGERDQAIATAHRVLAITDRDGVDPFLRGLSLNMLAWILGPEHDAEREDLLRRAIAQWVSKYGPDSVHCATLRGNAGVFAEERGDLETARAIFEQWERVGTMDFSDEPSDRLGSLYHRLGRLEEAERWLREASALYARNLGPRHASRLRVEARLAAVQAARGDRAAAFQTGLGAASLMREQLRIAARGAPERVVLKRVGTSRWGLDVAVSLAAPGLDPASRAALLDEVIRSRAVVLDEISGRRRLAALAGDPATNALAAEVAKYAMRLANLTVTGSIDEKVKALWRGRKERAEEALAIKSASFARTLASEKVGLEDVRRSLGGGTVLVSFVRYDADAVKARPFGVPPDPAGPGGAYLAFILGPGSEAPAIVPIGPASKVDGAVRAWREAITSVSSERHAVEVGDRLRQIIWDPVARRLEGARRVLIVPDGSVSFVSFPALPSDEGGYLVEKGPLVHLVSAERDIAVARSVPERTEEMLAVGDPSFGDTSTFAALREGAAPAADVPVAALEAPLGLEEEVAHAGVFLRGRRSSCGGFRSMTFERLPGTARELQAVVDLWGDRAQGLSGPAATEAIIKSEVTHHRLIHLATHGFFLGGECTGRADESRGFGGLTTTGPGEPEPALVRPEAPRENPLLFSGIALAGANHRGAAGPDEEDGILTAEEIAALDLSGVDWAVLSACDTGLGDIRASEGVFGLRRAFQSAGGGTLIMSLWPVDDESAREWMTALYRGRIGRKLDTADAVREASLAVLAHRRAAKQSTHPFYWAAFVAVGDWR